MNPKRPEILAVRAINQYRRRDILVYLGLRYYLQNSAAITDYWAKEIATNLVTNRTVTPYLRSFHFKDKKADGTVIHRELYLPGPNEALAEAVLLSECSSNKHAFSNPECVFSYNLTHGADRSGIFQQYMGGLKARHYAIAKACDDCPDGEVLCTDIKRFYPSITIDFALKAWQRHAELACLPEHHRVLGEKIIDEHGKVGGQGNRTILTGPMFSHLLANLVLRELDDECLNNLSVKYFRYVDDITIVGNQNDIQQSLEIIRIRLGDLGLSLHDNSSPKNYTVSTNKWLEGRNDYHESRRPISWKSLVGDLKRFLLQHPEEWKNLQRIFQDEGFRIPVRDYSETILESTCLERIYTLAQRCWFRRKAQQVSIPSLLNQARWLRKTYEDEFYKLFEKTNNNDGYDKKRRIPKLRYRMARLIYLGTDDTLSSIYPMAKELEELQFHAEVMKTVATANIDGIISFGTNAAQAAAQPIKAGGRSVSLNMSKMSPVQEQSLAVFLLNGVVVKKDCLTLQTNSKLLHFAKKGVDIELMKCSDPFLQELACLHGLSNKPYHPEILDTVFDKDEELAIDAIDQLQQSFSP